MKRQIKKVIFKSIILMQCICIGWAQQKSIVEEFTLSASNGNKLAGEIEYPNNEGKFPAAILIWGSGPHTRDQKISGTPIFKQIAKKLVAEGMAVMRLDKRGYGKSTGDFKSEDNYTTRDLANDIKLAYDYLNSHKSVDTTRVGLIGHSEGSIIASMLGAENKSIDWFILFGPSAVSGKEIELEQGKYQRKKLEMSNEISDAVGEVWKDYIEFIKDGYKDDSVYYQIGESFLLAHGLKREDERFTHKFIDQLLDGYKTPWYQYFYGHDNGKNLEEIKKPLLAILGGADNHTSVKLNFMPLYSSLEKAKNEKYKLVVLADEDHFFFRYKGKRIQKHKFGEMEMSSQFISTITAWLKDEGILKVD